MLSLFWFHKKNPDTTGITKLSLTGVNTSVSVIANAGSRKNSILKNFKTKMQLIKKAMLPSRVFPFARFTFPNLPTIAAKGSETPKTIIAIIAFSTLNKSNGNKHPRERKKMLCTASVFGFPSLEKLITASYKPEKKGRFLFLTRKFIKIEKEINEDNKIIEANLF